MKLKSKFKSYNIVNKKYNFLRPVKTQNLIRFGKKSDGGYVINSKVFKKCNTLISFGLGSDWSFELDCIKNNKNIKIHIYDHTVSTVPYYKDIFKYFRRLISFRGKYIFLINRIKYLLEFKNFLRLKNVNFYKEKITYPKQNSIDTDIDKVFSRLIEKEKIFLKCDIEGEEYKIIDGILKYASIIKMLIFEFHIINNKEKNFYNSIKKIQKYFDIIHIHGNNHASNLSSGLPEILEITFINRNYSPKKPKFVKSFPIKGLDFPNNPFKKDLFFLFNN